SKFHARKLIRHEWDLTRGQIESYSNRRSVPHDPRGSEAARPKINLLKSSRTRGPGGAPFQPVPGVHPVRAGCRAVGTARSWRGIVPFTHLAREGRMTVTIGRRELLAALGGATAAWPLTARAQQAAIPAIGYLNFGSPESDASRLTGLRRGLKETGYVEGRNFVIEYRWAGNQADRLPALAADLVQLRVPVIVAAGLLPVLAAKAATTSIPIVFAVGADPVQLGLVASLNRPGGKLTGFNVIFGELGAKGLALLHELVPGAATIGFLENRNNPLFALTTRDVLAAATVLGLKVQTLTAGTDREIDAAFASLVQARTAALLIGGDIFFNNRIERLSELAARQRFLPCTRIVSL